MSRCDARIGMVAMGRICVDRFEYLVHDFSRPPLVWGAKRVGILLLRRCAEVLHGLCYLFNTYSSSEISQISEYL